MAIIHIPTTPEVRKFILIEHRERVYMRGSEPIIKINRKQLLGNMIACLLNEDLTDFTPQKRPEIYLSFEIPAAYDRYWMSEQQAQRIRLHLDRYFKSDFCKYIDLCVSQGIEVIRSMDMYRALYDITEEDYPSENMHNYYYRYGRKNHPERLSSPDRLSFLKQITGVPATGQHAISV